MTMVGKIKTPTEKGPKGKLKWRACQGFGKGTQKKMLAAAKKGARVADKLIDEFGDDKTKRKKNTARKVAIIVSGSGADGHSVAKKNEQTAGTG